jgi:hypothetical protein
MRALGAAVPLTLAVGLVAASPAAARVDAHAGRAPVARAAGGDVGTPVYPALVNTRLVRTQKALDRAVDYADDGESAKAVSALYAARVQLKLAWRAAKYVIVHAPPPVGEPDAVARGHAKVPVRARASGGAVGGALADQFATAGAVLDLQHTTAATAVGMIDMAKGGLRDGLSRTLFTALDARDAAVAYIHSIDTPAPPEPDSVRARASGAPVAGGWASVMPGAVALIDDEISQIEGTIDGSTTLGAGVRRVLQQAEFQVTKTQRTINLFWPPLPGDD